MLISTTPNLEGKRIAKYLGIVSGETIMGSNIVKDIFTKITDIFGGRTDMYEKELKKAKGIAIDEMIAESTNLGENAIIGIDLDYETVVQGMLMVNVNRTAVVIE